MPFLAVIDSKKNQHLWAKAIVSLSSTADQIRFCVSPEKLRISAVNSAKTSHAEVEFHPSFFRDYSVSLKDIADDEYDQRMYSFIVTAKHIATIFRNTDSPDSSYICMKVQWARSTPSITRYKLLVEIETRSLLVKKYHVSYQPVLQGQNDISKFYRETWTQQSADRVDNKDPSKVSYMMIEQLILRQFVDTVPFSTEDFKIDVKNDKILFSGYTKLIIKEADYLKQPMSVTITLDLEELISSNFVGTPDDPLQRKTIDYRLRDFKNFMNLIATVQVEVGNEEVASFRDNSDCFEILFRQPGDPVLFELLNEKYVTVRYIQMTSLLAANDENIIPQSARLQLSLHQLATLSESRPITPDSNSTISGQNIHKRPFELPPAGKLGRLPHQGAKLVRRKGSVSPVHDSHGHSQHDFITYGSTDGADPGLDLAPSTKKRRTSDATDYSDSENDARNRDIPSVIPDSFGPTQLHERPKSIFE